MMINTPLSSSSSPSSFSPLLFHQDPIISNTCSFNNNNNNLTAPQLSATALLQKAAMVGAHAPGHVPSAVSSMDMGGRGGRAHVTAASLSPEWSYATWQQKSEGLTRDFLGLTRSGTGTGVVDRGRSAGNNVDVNVNVNVNFRDLLSYAGEVQFPTYDVYP